MKSSLVLILGVVSAIALANTPANATTTVSNPLSSIVDRVSQCSVLPFSLDRDGQKTYHALISHCPEVKILSPGVAKIKISGHIYKATLAASVDSDGDFYEVIIQDLRSRETQTLSNVAAYGDILLGVLGGDTRRVMEQEVSAADVAESDATLVH